jgi:hypothetical protein
VKPLGGTERRIIVGALVYARVHGTSPTWTELRVAIGADRLKFVRVIVGLRRKGLVTYDDDRERSLAVTDLGKRMALTR